MKKWILLLTIVLVLVALVLMRERFADYSKALADVGQASGYIIPKCAEGYTIDTDYTVCTKEGSMDTVSPTCPSNAAYSIREGQGVCEPTSQPPTSAGGPVCPEGYTIDKSGSCVRESQPVNGVCSAGTLTDGKCKETAEAACPPGTKVDGTSCVPAPAMPMGNASLTVTATPSSTGGSSGVLTGAAPTPAPTGPGKNVFGPAFPGLGANGRGLTDDSTKTTQYPMLMGGFPNRPPPPDKMDLPSGNSLGTEAGSEFLPFARLPGGLGGGFGGAGQSTQPGDMDLVPNPYRVSSTYAGRQEREPVPFLTDFSAFFR
jgi:hypothetical protein